MTAPCGDWQGCQTASRGQIRVGRVEAVGQDLPATGTACRFLETFNFDVLLSPVARARFEDRYWQRAPLLVQRGNPDFYGDLFSLADFDRAVATGPVSIKIAEAKTKKIGRNEANTASGLDQTIAEMRDGATLVLDALNTRDPKLGLLCRLLSQELGHKFQTNLYLTPPGGQGFTPHWDNHDVFSLQVAGSKHWKVEKQRRKLPGKLETMDEHRELAADADSFTLQQGDLMYVPRGFVHAAECGPEASLHITLGIHPFTRDDLLHAAVQKLIGDDETLRYALPLGFLSGGADRLVADIMPALRKIARPEFLSAAVDQFRDEIVAKFPLDVSGQIENFYRPPALALGDVFAARRGIVYRLHAANDLVRLNFGSRGITFLGIFREALDFALRAPAFAIRELPGDLQDEERIVFIERLLQEGLVVRK